MLVEATLDEAAQRAFADRALAAVPGTVFFGVRDAGTSAAAEAGYRALALLNDHKRNPAEWDLVSRDELLGLPNNKIAIRHPDLRVDELHQIVRTLDLSDVTSRTPAHPSSTSPRPGCPRRGGLARLCEHLGLGADEVIAFGDELNDVEMLSWAGYAVAIQQAGPAVRGVADRIAPGNDDDGLAQVLEGLVADGRFGPVG